MSEPIKSVHQIRLENERDRLLKERRDLDIKRGVIEAQLKLIAEVLDPTPSIRAAELSMAGANTRAAQN